MENSEKREPLQRERVTISIESCQQFIESIGNDGTEIQEKEPTQLAKFSELLRQIDFTKDSHKQTANLEENRLLHLQSWQAVDDHLNSSRREIEQIIDLIDMIQKDVFLSVSNITKPSAPSSIQIRDFAVRVVSKQTELQKASSRLKTRAKEMNNVCNKEKSYFQDLMKVRSSWKTRLDIDKNKKLSQVFVDYSYKTGGSSYDTNEVVQFTKSEQGSLCLIKPLPGTRVARGISVSSSASQGGSSSSYFGFGEETLESIAIEGWSNINKYLTNNLQNSLFCEELFSRLTKDALDGSIPFVQVEENEIRLEYTNYHSLVIQLLTKTKESEDGNSSRTDQDGSSNNMSLVLIPKSPNPRTLIGINSPMDHGGLNGKDSEDGPQDEEKEKTREKESGQEEIIIKQRKRKRECGSPAAADLHKRHKHLNGKTTLPISIPTPTPTALSSEMVNGSLSPSSSSQSPSPSSPWSSQESEDDRNPKNNNNANGNGEVSQKQTDRKKDTHNTHKPNGDGDFKDDQHQTNGDDLTMTLSSPSKARVSIKEEIEPAILKSGELSVLSCCDSGSRQPFKEDWKLMMMEIYLQVQLRNQHKNRFGLQMKLPGLCDPSLRQQKGESSILKSVSVLYQHSCFRERVSHKLEQLARIVPHLAIHWTASTQPLTSSFFAVYENTLAVQATLNYSEIDLGPSTVIGGPADKDQTFRCGRRVQTETELVEALVQRICEHLLDTLHTHALSSHVLALRRISSLVLPTFFSSPTTSSNSLKNQNPLVIHVEPDVDSLGVRIHLEPPIVEWEDLVGPNNQSKLSSLFLLRKKQAFSHQVSSSIQQSASSNDTDL
eukprot:TRINITY_DN5556_c0_g1_i1.p1 TRINITY_DN5556_c0_g1~~TRINITY_DN5556_c0_g1_i1.p1  ORF type:complete len:849 (+),score=184.51 TRINITY_DN5556_c0_g1_i1:52-2547(+)